MTVEEVRKKPVQSSVNRGKLYLDKREDGWYWTAYGKERGGFPNHHTALGNYNWYMTKERMMT